MRDGEESSPIYPSGLIVKKWLVVSVWAGQQSGHDGYLLWDLIGQLA